MDIRLYRVIYHATEDIENAMKGMREPEFKEVVLGHATVGGLPHFRCRQCCRLLCHNGKIVRNSEIRVVRDGIVILSNIDSLLLQRRCARGSPGYECGIGIERCFVSERAISSRVLKCRRSSGIKRFGFAKAAGGIPASARGAVLLSGVRADPGKIMSEKCE